VGSRLGYRATDRILAAIPPFFDYGLYQVILSYLVGAELVIARTDDPWDLIAALTAVPVTVVPLVPSLAGALLAVHARFGGLASTRMVTSTGAPLSDALMGRLRAALPQAVVVRMYGISECKRVSIMPPDEAGSRPGSVGLSLPGTSIDIVDDHGRSLPVGEIGEIVAIGPHVMSGYWNDPAASAKVFVRTGDAAPQLRTGDFGYLDEQNYLYLVGRRDDQFKCRGVRTSATEIENAAEDIPEVAAAALVVPDGTEPAHLFVTARDPAARLRGDQVLAALAGRLESAKIPHQCSVLAEFPMTGNGKVDKRRLRSLNAGSPGAREVRT
jgi:acyl-CoA synthetase (AMP-forming)/AMP-acid ligase II